MDTYMDQLNSGKKITKPSDDPVVAVKGMSYRTQLIQVEQHKRNTNEVHNWMDNSDAALDKATQAMQKIRELAVQASNDTYDAEERENIQEEVKQLKEHLKSIANTNVNDNYIFNGTNTNQAPISEVEGEGGNKEFEFNFSEELDPVMIEVASGTKLQANVDVSEIFGEDLFKDIDDFIDALGRDNQGDIEASIGTIDGDIDKVINARADLGARMNRLELVENRLGEQEVIATKTLSDNEDIEYDKVITQLLTQESLLRASLSAGSRIIQPSLMDFLR